MDQILDQKIDAFLEANKEQMLKDIGALVAINSVEAAPAEGAPFGPGARAALDKTLELAGRLGLDTHNCEGYIGYAELPGREAGKYLATICHVDVVPAGEGWSGDPFAMRRQDGWILGRGVLDDKGPHGRHPCTPSSASRSWGCRCATPSAPWPAPTRRPA